MLLKSSWFWVTRARRGFHTQFEHVFCSLYRKTHIFSIAILVHLPICLGSHIFTCSRVHIREWVFQKCLAVDNNRIWSLWKWRWWRMQWTTTRTKVWQGDSYPHVITIQWSLSIAFETALSSNNIVLKCWLVIGLKTVMAMRPRWNFKIFLHKTAGKILVFAQ